MPPTQLTELRPHLDQLLQKNLELEHVIADLRHQLTQSSTRWADERKTLGVRCDALMASFAKFRARLDTHPSDRGASDSDRGEVEADSERDQGPPEDLHERCRALAAELRVREEEVVQSRNSSKTGLEKLDLANQEISRFKLLLQEWKKYGSEWKRDAQIARARASELQLREDAFSAQVEAAAAAAEHQRTICQESAKRNDDLEAMVKLLRCQLSPEQLAAFDFQQNQATPRPSGSTQSPTPHADTNTNKSSDLIELEIPYRANKSIRTPSAENIGHQDEQQTVASSSQQAPSSQSIPVDSVPQKSNDALGFNTTDFEVCIHTCNPLPCRNDSQSFLWPRTPGHRSSLPRHALSTQKHPRCTPDCPGHRPLNMPPADAAKEPRGVKCRPPTEAELALAAEETRTPPSERASEEGTGVEGVIGNNGSLAGEPGEPDEPEGGSTREEEAQENEEELSPRIIALVKKRARSRMTDGEESRRARKRRPTARISK